MASITPGIPDTAAATADRQAGAGTGGSPASRGCGPQPTYHEPTFRTWPPELLTGRDGTTMAVTLCEELVEGRWEPFCGIQPRPQRPAAPKRASAHRPPPARHAGA